VALELSAGGVPTDDAATEALAASVLAVLRAMGVLPSETVARPGEGLISAPSPRTPLLAEKTVRVRAPVGGLVSAAVPPGAFVRAGAVLARLAPPLAERGVALTAPADAVVLEGPGGGAARKGAVLYVLAPTPLPSGRRRAISSATGLPSSLPAAEEPKLRVGWVEHVTLPDLDVRKLKAKIDTGARTSALHVSRMRVVDTAGGPHRRPILEITVPGGGRGRKPHRLRAAVREHVVVRDTSGRMERRPVIETALQLGPFKRRIAVTLTNRGDMLFPMLIGRTALGAGIVVDPARRYLLGR
jgi:hypothetical protein